MRRLLGCVLASLCCSSVHPASPQAAEAYITEMLKKLGATPSACADTLRAPPSAHEPVCAVAPAKAKDLVNRWDTLQEDAKLGAKPVTEWRREQQFLFGDKSESYQRTYRVDGAHVAVFLDQKTRRLLLNYSTLDGCPPPPSEDQLEDSSKPTLVSKVAPAYPQLARLARREGYVMVHAVIELDGSVSQTCVVKGSEPGLGFEEAALEAVSRWRYSARPASAEPAQTSLLIAVEFELTRREHGK